MQTLPKTSIVVLSLIILLVVSCKIKPKVYYEENEYLEAFVEAGKSKSSQVVLPNNIQFGMKHEEVNEATTDGIPRFVLPSGENVDAIPEGHNFYEDRLVIFGIRIVTIKSNREKIVEYLDNEYRGISYFHLGDNGKTQSWFDGNVEIALSSSIESQGFLIEYINANDFVK